MDQYTYTNSGAINIQPLKSGKIALVDADYLKYIFSSRMSKKLTEKEADVFAKESLVLQIGKELLFELFQKIQDPIIFCFSGKSYNTFRYHLAVDREYKGNRKKDELYEGADKHIFEFMDFVIKNYITLLFEDLEADDIVSVLQDENTYIVSKDKDLNQIPGFHFNFQTNQIYEISKEEALWHLANQLLQGDPTDNIAAIDGVGPKKAFEILNNQPAKSLMNIVFRKYQEKFGIFEGLCRFSECVQLVKMRMNRGEWFRKKYIKMFDLKERMLLELKKQQL